MSTAPAHYQDNTGEQAEGQHPLKSAQFRREKNSATMMLFRKR